MAVGWRAAMAAALYGPAGFFVTGSGPAAHFRTSVHASPVFCATLLRLVEQVDLALGRPDRLDLVDIGAGRGELLRALCAQAPPDLARRLRPVAVELAPRPADLPPEIDWRTEPPVHSTGLVVATEWLDNVPLDAAQLVEPDRSAPPADPAEPANPAGPEGLAGPAGPVNSAESWGVRWRRVLVDPATGAESLGGAVEPAEAAWLARWWPPAHSTRAEIGLPRDLAWAGAVGTLERGLALAVDYGHLADDRPPLGTLTGFRAGRQVPPVPDGTCDITAHVAVDSAAAAGSAAAGTPYTLVRQRMAMRALGADGGRPPLALAATDPAGYLRALAAASATAELTDPAGLGGHWWLLQPVGAQVAAVVARWPT
ncbi:SAM-dependent methyltransferase [Solwaraspora sp. WMMD1047]|uniref:SAM-dependent methyltransferase n=1 Tax=Solwaraspora sp. WMMD1047 TaxID=3016102 RepID=UPI0024180F26|nr:SAM-dependent methyltransferase [Solwaraspora sp. WMMD1047]MDG4828070.1 SAM-dependent methyltransferase [Solwaraspora sp. WMMD1047]